MAWRNHDQPLEVLAQMVAELAAMRSEQAAVFCLPGGITAGSVRAPDAPVRESGSSDQFLAITATAPTGVPRAHGGKIPTPFWRSEASTSSGLASFSPEVSTLSTSCEPQLISSTAAPPPLFTQVALDQQNSNRIKVSKV